MVNSELVAPDSFQLVYSGNVTPESVQLVDSGCVTPDSVHLKEIEMRCFIVASL